MKIFNHRLQILLATISVAVVQSFFFTPLAHAAGNVSVCDEANFRFALIGGGLVTFGCSGTIALTTTLGGTITLGNAITIDGNGQQVTITPAGNFAVFNVAPLGSIILKNMTITVGGIFVGDTGSLQLQGMTLRNINGTAINSAGFSGISVNDSSFIDNVTPGFGAAIANGIAGSINIKNSLFRNNRASRGGAVYASQTGYVTIEDSVFDGNSAAPTDGTPALGGALYLANTDLDVKRSAFIDNVAQGAAGSGSTGAGGGVALGGAIRADMSGTRIIKMAIANTTVSGNRALGGNGGRGFGTGGNGGLAAAGAISQEGDRRGGFKLSSVTFVDNFAQGGMGGSCLAPGCVPGFNGNSENLIYRIAAAVEMNNSLFATRFGGGCVSYDGVIDRGFNLEYGSGACTDPSVVSNVYADPLVLPVADNGGATPTIALASGSPAISAGAIGCLDIAGIATTVDQRGLPRKTPRCDIGAYETQPLPLAALTGVLSRKLHGPAGAFDLAIDQTVPIGGAITVEPRTIGSGHTIVFQFDAPIISVGAVNAVDGAANPVGAATATIVGNAVDVTLTGVPDNQRALVSMNNINGIGINVSAAVGFLAGDVNNTRSVNSSDISGVKARSGQTVTASNFMLDIDTSGAINLSDISAVKVRSGLVLSR